MRATATTPSLGSSYMSTSQEFRCVPLRISTLVFMVSTFCSPYPAFSQEAVGTTAFAFTPVSNSRQACLNSMSPSESGFLSGFTAHVKLGLPTQSPELASNNVGTAFDPRPCNDLHVISQGPKDRTIRGGKQAETKAAIAPQQTQYHVFAAWVQSCVKCLVRGVDTATETSAT
jgi:hypothetical protein